MRPGVVTDFIAFADDALHQPDVVGGFVADEQEGAFDVLLLQDVKDLGRPPRIGAVVERERKLIGMVAILFNGVGARIHIHVLVDDELLARIGLVGVDFDCAFAWLGQTGNAQDIPVSLGVNVVAGLDGAERLERRRIAGMVPNVPQ